MSYGVGCRRGSDPELLWMWLWLAAAAPTGPLAWELINDEGVALKKKEKRDKKILLLPRCTSLNIPVFTFFKKMFFFFF